MEKKRAKKRKHCGAKPSIGQSEDELPRPRGSPVVNYTRPPKLCVTDGGRLHKTQVLTENAPFFFSQPRTYTKYCKQSIKPSLSRSPEDCMPSYVDGLPTTGSGGLPSPRTNGFRFSGRNGSWLGHPHPLRHQQSIVGVSRLCEEVWINGSQCDCRRAKYVRRLVVIAFLVGPIVVRFPDA